MIAGQIDARDVPWPHGRCWTDGVRRSAAVALLVAGLGPLAPGAAWGQTQWTAVDLGSFGRFTRAVTLNEAGQVVGGSERAPGQYEAFITGPHAQGGMRSLAPPGSVDSFASDVNDRGVAVGWMGLADGSQRVFVTGPDGAGPRELPLFPDSYRPASMVAAPRVNASGQVTGSVTTAEGPFRFFITGPDAQGLTDIGPANYGDNVIAINTSGQVLQSRSMDSGWDGCFLTGPNGQGGSFVSLPAEASGCFPADLDDEGRVLGQLFSGGGWGRSFVTGAGGLGLQWLPQGLSVEDMNRHGAVIGSALAAGGAQRHAFLVHPDGRMTDLNDLIGLPDGEYFAFGYGVNDNGELIADSNLGRAFLLSAVPEVSTVAMCSVGFGLLSIMVRRRRNGAAALTDR